MKSVIIYYSHSGNTSLAAHKFWGALKAKGESELYRLRYVDTKRSLTRQLLYRLRPSLAEITGVPFNLSDYELICIGSPVWGGRPAPLITKYLSQCSNIAGKKVIYFQVFGIEASAEISEAHVKRALEEKGVSEVINVDIDWHEGRDETAIDKLVQGIVDKVVQ